MAGVTERFADGRSRLPDLGRATRRGSELSRQIAVDFKADADFE
jgi:hypothetical protein